MGTSGKGHRIIFQVPDLVHGWRFRDEESGISQPGKFQGDECWPPAFEAIDEFDILGIARLQGDAVRSEQPTGDLVAQPHSHSPPLAIFVQKRGRGRVQTYIRASCAVHVE